MYLIYRYLLFLEKLFPADAALIESAKSTICGHIYGNKQIIGINYGNKMM